MKMSACQLITTKAKGVHRCESITLPCWWHKFDGNLRKWIRRKSSAHFELESRSVLNHLALFHLAYILALLWKKKGGTTTKCSPITAVWCAQTAHITCAWWIGWIMHSSNDCSLHLTNASIITMRCWEWIQNMTIGTPKIQLTTLPVTSFHEYCSIWRAFLTYTMKAAAWMSRGRLYDSCPHLLALSN